MKIKLSKYSDELYEQQKKEFEKKCKIIIDYLMKNIKDVNLEEVAKTKNRVEIYLYLNGWLFNYYKDKLFDAFKLIDYDKTEYEKQMLYSFIMSITRDRSNLNVLYSMFRNNKIINEVKQYEDGMYEIETDLFGNINFYKALDLFQDDKKIIDYINSLGNNLKDGCHEVTYYVLCKYKKMKAVTALLTKELGCTQYHSFLLDEETDYVIDFARNIAMPKEMYYRLNNVVVVNEVTYDECMKENEISKPFDESESLYNLLRNALYKEYTHKHK